MQELQNLVNQFESSFNFYILRNNYGSSSASNEFIDRYLAIKNHMWWNDETKYANLSDEVYVAVGDTVEEGTEIGTVGNSSGIFTAQICGDVLNLQVQDANGNDVDPEAYFNFQ